MTFSNNYYNKLNLVIAATISIISLPAFAQNPSTETTPEKTQAAVTTSAQAAEPTTTVAAATPPDQTQSSDEQEIKDQAQQFAKLFQAGDADGISKLWASDGSFIDAGGRKYNGRNEIKALYEQFFKNSTARNLTLNVGSITFPSSNLAVEEGSTEIIQPGEEETASSYSAFHVKRDGKWQMFKVIEYAERSAIKVSTMNDLSWLIGTWSIKGRDDAAKLEAHWLGDKKFIECIYQTGSPKKAIALEVIGIDPKTKQITSWYFGSNGELNSGKWRYSRANKCWLVANRGVDSNGTTSGATHVWRIKDNNHLSWQLTGRYRNSIKLPNMGTIELVRD